MLPLLRVDGGGGFLPYSYICVVKEEKSYG